MAEFENLSSGTSDGGGKSPLKKFKLTKKNVVLFGGGLLIVLFLVSRVMGRQGGEEGGSGQSSYPAYYDDGNPMNSAMVQSQLSNNSDLLMGQVDSALTDFANQLGSNNLQFQDSVTDSINAVGADIKKQQQAYTDKQNAALEKKLAELAKQNAKLEGTFNDFKKQNTSKPAPKGSKPPATPTANKPAPSSKPKAKPKATTPKYKTVTVKKGDTLSQLTAKYGKGGDKKSYTAVAKFNGIKNPDKIKVGQKIKILV
ncbi:LysM peptidoglycan-binding domain-containing protein [Bacillus sp. WC2502]|uniref:LysM peptidoglycan-binding domain-containing protein n=1 Tax=Bacillus sp. WC2502 TaxID=3461401 RepID=UPI0040450004